MNKAPTKIFELFLDDEAVELIAMHSKLSAASKGATLEMTSEL